MNQSCVYSHTACLSSSSSSPLLQVGQAVFRKTENPMAFETDWMKRVLSKAHIHATYSSLLLFPHSDRLSADYSFNCTSY